MQRARAGLPLPFWGSSMTATAEDNSRGHNKRCSMLFKFAETVGSQNQRCYQAEL